MYKLRVIRQGAFLIVQQRRFLFFWETIKVEYFSPGAYLRIRCIVLDWVDLYTESLKKDSKVCEEYYSAHTSDGY